MVICFRIVFYRSFRASEPIFTVTAAEARILCLRAYREPSSRYQLRLRRATGAALKGVPGGEMIAIARSIDFSMGRTSAEAAVWRSAEPHAHYGGAAVLRCRSPAVKIDSTTELHRTQFTPLSF